MILDFIVVTVSAVLLTMFTVQKKNIINQLSRNSLICGVFLSVLKMLFLTGTLEKFDNPQFSVSSIIIMIIIRFRPLLIGAFYKVLFIIVEKLICKKNPEKEEIKIEGKQEKPRVDFSILSRREIEVAKLAAKGYTNVQIAEALFISTETVKCHMASIFEKLNITSRKDLINNQSDS